MTQAQGSDTAPLTTFGAPDLIRRMLFTTWTLLNSFSRDQQLQAIGTMDDPRRIDWDFIPKPDRIGVPLFQMDHHQRQLAMSLLKTGLSMEGYAQVLSIMAIENILRETEVKTRGFGVFAADFRDPEGYWFSFFGRPAFEDTWGWRFLGHHVCLSFTIVRQESITVTPMVLGQMPVPAGALNPLGGNEEHAFKLLNSLSGDNRSKAIIHGKAPADLVTRQVAYVGNVEFPDYVDLGIAGYGLNDQDRVALRFEKANPSGVNGAALTDRQLTAARELLLRFVEVAPEEVAAVYRKGVEALPPEQITFAWAGGTDPDTSYYYRVSTPDLLVESDNAVAQGQHIHAIWRDLKNDLGRDLLLEHYVMYGHEYPPGGDHLARRLVNSDEQLDDPAWGILKAQQAAIAHDHHSDESDEHHHEHHHHEHDAEGNR